MIKVLLNGQPVKGAKVIVNVGAFLGIQGYLAEGITDYNGEWKQPPPNILNAPIGSTADVKVLYTDVNGRTYTGQDTLTVVPDIYDPSTGFEAWNPDPLIINLISATKEDEQIFKQTETTVSTGYPTNILNTLIFAGAGLIALYIIIRVVLSKW